MRVFGCTAYARKPYSLRSKLDDKGIKCNFIEYAQHGYRLWCEDQGQIIHSYNVTFDEESFCNANEKIRNVETDDLEQDDIEETEPEKDAEKEISNPEIMKTKMEYNTIIVEIILMKKKIDVWMGDPKEI